MTRSEILKELFVKHGLFYDSSDPNSKENDVFKHKNYTIITRGGIQKIERNGGWRTRIKIEASGKDYCNVSGEIYSKEGEALYSTLASASELNSTNKYYVEMAEKRCRSRLILTVAGLYELGGVYGEDEIDDMKRESGAKKVVMHESAGE